MNRIAIMFPMVLILTISICSCSSQEQDLRTKVEALVEVSEYQKAIELIDEFIMSNPTSPFGRELKTEVLLWKGDDNAAYIEYRKYFTIAQEHSRQLIEIFLDTRNTKNISEIVAYFMELDKTEESDVNTVLSEFLLVNFQKQELNPKGTKRYIRALGLTKSDDAIAFIAKFAENNNKDEIVRKEAIQAIGRAGNQGGVIHLLPILEDPSESIRICAAENLLLLDNYEGASILIPLLRDKVRKGHWSVQLTNIKILVKLAKGDEKAIQELLNLLRSITINHDKRQTYKQLDVIISSLLEIGSSSEAIESLLLIIEDFPASLGGNNVLKNSLTYLRDADKTPDQVKRVAEAFVQFIKNYTIGDREGMVDRHSTTRTAFECLEVMAPQLANQLRNEIPKSKLQKRGIN